MSDAVERWRAGALKKDTAAMLDSVSEGVRLHSPITLRHTFQGKQELGALFDAVFAVIDDLHYDHELQSGDTRVLIHGGTVRGQEFNETTFMRLGPDGLIEDITLFIRPLPALVGFAAALGPRLAPTRLRALLVTLMIGPIAFMLRTGDPAAMKLVFGSRKPR